MSSKSDFNTLLEMGFAQNRVEKAWKATKGAGLQPAMDWLIAHGEDADIDDPPTEAQALGGPSAVSSAALSAALSASAGGDDEGEIQDGEQTAQSLICTDCQKLFRDAAAAERHAVRTGHVSFAESTTAIKPLTEEERAEKLAELKQRLAEKRALRALEEKEEQKTKEKIRRKTGQDLTLVKEKLEEAEMKKALDAKKKEKEDEKKAKARIMAEIELDKKNRAAKKEAAKQVAEVQAVADAAAAAAASGAKKEYTETRLQIRQPEGGTPLTHTFQADDRLAAVYQFVATQRQGSFKLMTTFPKKVFGTEDESKTLKELNLVPSALLVISNS